MDNKDKSSSESLSNVEEVVTEQKPIKVDLAIITNYEKEKKKKNKLFKKIIVILSLIVGIVLLGIGGIGLMKLLPGNNLRTSNDEDPQISLSPTIAVSVDDILNMSLDSDNDGIPDQIELKLGYDAKANDCVRNAGCGEVSGNLPMAKLRLNVVFVIDASGSMDAESAGQNKWDSAKSALIELFNKSFPSYMDVGVIMYGHVGSSAVTDREISCNGVEVIKEMSRVNTFEVDGLLGNVSPQGWTPLAKSLHMAGELLADREGEANYIVVLSDGQETCGGDPVAVAKKLHESGIEVTTNVVGLALSEEEKKQLQAIASSGGGGFFPADEPQELARALRLSTEVLLRWDELNRCIADNVVIYSQCVGVQYLKAINEVQSMKLKYIEDNAPAVGGLGVVDVREFEEVENKIFKTYEQLREDNWEQYRRDLELLAPR